MIYITNLKEITSTKFSIGYEHHMPFDEKYGLHKTAEQLQQEGVLVEVPVQPILKGNEQATLYYNPIANECFYEVVEFVNEQSELEQLRAKTIELEQTMDSILTEVLPTLLG